MVKNYYKIYLVITLTFFTQFSFAQFTSPKYSNEFLNVGVGARGFAMGNAQVASAGGVESAYWNPAQLNEVSTQFEGALMHAEYFAGIIKYDYAGFATKIDSNSAFGITAIRLGVDDIPDTRFLFDASGALNYDNVRFFSASDYAFIFSYAHRYKNWNLGGNAKVIYRNVGLFANAWGFGLDVGIHRKWSNGLTFGACVYDVSTTFNAWTINSSLLEETFVQTDNEIPLQSIELTLPKANIGGAYEFSIYKNFNALTTMDAQVTFDGERNSVIKTSFASIDPRMGIELDYKKIFFVRTGLSNFQQIKNFDGTTYWSMQPNIGVGLKIKNVSLDYALTDVGDASEVLFSNIFSIKVAWNKK